MEHTETPLERAIRTYGGITKLARDLGVNGHSVVYQWAKTRVPAEWCPEVESLTGVRCEELRPDVNWAVLRGQPADAGITAQATEGVQEI